MLENRNKINIRRNRFCDENTKFEEKSFSCLKMKKYFKSIHDVDNKFTNYDKSDGTKTYKELRLIYKDYRNGSNILNKYFVIDELLSDKRKINRLINIIKLNTNIAFKYGDFVNSVYKYKHNRQPNIQLYVQHKNNELNLILVDIHHLGIYGKKNGKYIHERQYENNKNNKMDIKKIADEL